MSSDVVLSAALRNNLLSLQQTQRSIDRTQLRLSTGLKVNSALDNPQNFFASQALKNRASDIQRLLDGIGQNIQVIKAADAGVTALTQLVEQAESIATNARDALVGGSAEAKAVGNVDLKGVDDLASKPGWSTGASLTFSVTDKDGNVLHVDPYGAGNVGTSETIAITSGMSTADLINSINDLVNAADNSHVLEASLDDKGQLVIKTLNGGRFNVNFTTTGNTDPANLGVANLLGFGNIAKAVLDGGAGSSNNVEFTASNAVTLDSFKLYDSSTTPRSIAQRGDPLNTIVDSSGTALFVGIDSSANDVYTIGINGGAKQSIPLARTAGNTPITIQEFVDSINNNAALNSKIQASFNDDTGQISIQAIDSTVTSVQVGVKNAGSAVTANFGFGLNSIVATTTTATEENIQLAAASGSLANYQHDFNKLRDQIDALVSNGDTGYRGTNLLGGDDLETFFNEFRSSSLVTQGVNFTASGLGVNAATFSNAASVDDTLEEVRNALTAVRNFGATLANDLSVIQTRQDYAETLINTLNEGGDKLTIADQNEEGAKLLALQTRQQLGVTSLSLASQSQQAILRLF